MSWTDRLAPSPDDFAALARQAIEGLPAALRDRAGPMALRIEDFAPDALLDALGVADAFGLTGHFDRGTMTLYRRAVLDEWCERGDVALDALVAGVLVEELGGTAPAVPFVAVGNAWAGVRSPSLEDFVEVGGRALANLPPAIRAAVGDVRIRVDEFADDEVLDALGIEDAFELTGVYEGVDLTRRSVFDVSPAPSSIRLFRRPILDEWSEGDVGFETLVEHVFVHEVAHHFGFSDEGIDAVERS